VVVEPCWFFVVSVTVFLTSLPWPSNSETVVVVEPSPLSLDVLQCFQAEFQGSGLQSLQELLGNQVIVCESSSSVSHWHCSLSLCMHSR
jgi:hypothetical protein